MTEDYSTKTVLVVDDDIDFLDQQRIQLEAMGFTVVTAESEAQADEVLVETRPDLAVVDLMMEQMDGGFALAYRIKKIDETIPVIMVTGVGRDTGMSFDAATKEERAWIKADAFLAKPVRFEQLKHEIDRLTRE